MNERLTEKLREAFAPSNYRLKSKNDTIIKPYGSYDLFYEITFEVIPKLGRYEDLGTVEELERLKQQERAIISNVEGDGYDNSGNLIFDTWICPSCNTRYEIDYNEYHYCPNCGQKIDRTELDEMV